MSSSSSPGDGHVIWLFGLSGAGKSTLSDQLVDRLRRQGRPPLVLDGDALRSGLCRGLGFSDAEREENLRRAAEVARLGVLSGLTVIASFITPLEAHRRQVAHIVGRSHLSLIYLNAPLAVCQSRDTKGLYAKARQGLVRQMTGISSGFEPPGDYDLELNTGSDTVNRSAAILADFIAAKRPGSG